MLNTFQKSYKSRLIHFKLFSFFLLLLISQESISQKAKIKKADKLYNKQYYYDAANSYENALFKKRDSVIIAAKIADSYNKIGYSEKALEWYRYIQKKNTLTETQYLRLMLLERQFENYLNSEILINNFNKTFDTNDIINNYLINLKVEDLLKEKGMFSVNNLNINTNYSEIGANFYSTNQIVLLSSKRREKRLNRVYSWADNCIYDIYIGTKNGETIGDFKLIKSKGKPDYFDGTISLNNKTGYVYFTSNNLSSKSNKKVVLKIYKGKIEGNQLIDINELSINNSQYSNAYPYIDQSGTKMYFSSDRLGGFGGMDIYSIELDNNGNCVGMPVNLGPNINTSLNELFPFHNGTENLLFFSSEGHFGLGGLDVFVSKLDRLGNPRIIENLGVPINSPKDDFIFIHDEQQTTGFISSNRKDGQGVNDVYHFIQNSKIKNIPVVWGVTQDIVSGDTIKDALIQLMTLNGEILDSVQSNNQGTFDIPIDKYNHDVQIVAIKKGYSNYKKTIVYQESNKVIEEQIKMTPIIGYYFDGVIAEKGTSNPLSGVKVTFKDIKNSESKPTFFSTNEKGVFESESIPYLFQDEIEYEVKLELDGYVTKQIPLKINLTENEKININEYLSVDMTKIEIGKTDLNEVVEIAPIYFELNSSYLTKESSKELDKVVKIMNENPDMIIEIGSHTDSRASDHYNNWLSDRRAKSSVQYIISQGINEDRISGKGYGKTKLIHTDSQIAKALNDEEKEILHQKNRRTEFIIVKMK